ncbi:MAG TPA: hypothetical protein VFQ65_15465, partial [Kofleriaceae bacterium]|nr:hypothetical protein [Kofleriaceae bacterium]
PLCGWAVLIITVGFVVRTLRDERALLEISDPAAGSELFTIRGAIRELRANLMTARIYWRRVPLRLRMLTGVVALVGCTWGAVHYWRSYAKDHSAAAFAADHIEPQIEINALTPAMKDPTNPTAPPTFKVERIGSRFWVEALLDANGEATIPMTGFRTVPESWRATLAVELVSAGPLGFTSEDSNVRYLSSANPRMELTVDACTSSKPLAVHVTQRGDANKKVTFWVVPTLTVATCR